MIARPRRRVLWASAAALAVVVIASTIWWGWADPPPPEGPSGDGASGRAPAFSLEDVRDPQSTVSLADYAGQPVVVNFWASWCVPCRKEMPELQSAYQEVKARVAFVGVDHLDARAAAVGFLDETGVTYPSGFDPDGDVAREFGLFGLPTTVFVSSGGRILERTTGALTEDRLLEIIDRLFRRSKVDA